MLSFLFLSMQTTPLLFYMVLLSVLIIASKFRKKETTSPSDSHFMLKMNLMDRNFKFDEEIKEINCINSLFHLFAFNFQNSPVLIENNQHIAFS